MADYFKIAFVLLLAEVATAHPRFMMSPFHKMRMMRGLFPPPFHPFAFKPLPPIQQQTVLHQTVLPQQQQQQQQSQLTVVQPAGQPALLPTLPPTPLFPTLPQTPMFPTLPQAPLLPVLPQIPALLPALPATSPPLTTTTTQLLLQQLQILLQQRIPQNPLLPVTQTLQLQQLLQLLLTTQTSQTPQLQQLQQLLAPQTLPLQQLLAPQNQLQPAGALGSIRAETILARLAEVNERLAASLEASSELGVGQVPLDPALQQQLRSLNLASPTRSRSITAANTQASSAMGPADNFAQDRVSVNAGPRRF